MVQAVEICAEQERTAKKRAEVRRLIRIKAGAGVLAALMILLTAAGCQTGKEYTYYYYDYFDTFSSLTVYAPDETAAKRYDQIVRDYLSAYDALLDAFEPHEGVVSLYTVNEKAGTAPVAVSEELCAFLEYGLAAYDKSGKTVNIALGSVTALWQEQLNKNTEGGQAESKPADGSSETGSSEDSPSEADPAAEPQLPDPDALREAARHTDPSDVVLDPAGHTVYFRDPQIRLDAGALGKGYVCAKIEEALRAAGCRSALFSAGGNVMTIGTYPGLAGWNVGIRNPDPEAAEQVYTVWQVKDASVVTSGDYERYFMIGNTRYHHIIDPETMYPGTRYHSVTVSCRDAAVADMLSTALFLLPEEEGRALAAEYDARVLYIYNDYSAG